MNHETQRASILQMAQGAFQERVDYEMQRCVDTVSYTHLTLPTNSLV